MLQKGAKVDNPQVRATNKKGTVHAVNREGATLNPPAPAKTYCGKQTIGADQPIKRFQVSGVASVCPDCAKKVQVERAETVKYRKSLRSVKNRVAAGMEEPKARAATPVAKPVAKKVPAKRVAAAKVTKPVEKVATVTPIKQAGKVRAAAVKQTDKAKATAANKIAKAVRSSNKKPAKV